MRKKRLLHFVCYDISSYKHYRAATAIILLVFFFYSAILSLILYFSGTDTISGRLMDSIPIELAYRNSHYYGNRIDPNQQDDHFGTEAEYFETYVDAMEALCADEALSYGSYNLTISLRAKNYFPVGRKRDTQADLYNEMERVEYELMGAGEDGEQTSDGSLADQLISTNLAGIRSLDFFDHNNIQILERTEAPWSDRSVFVPDAAEILDEHGDYRKVRLGDQIEIYDAANDILYRTYTVDGIYRHLDKFDYSYGSDASFIYTGALYVSNSGLGQILQTLVQERTKLDERFQLHGAEKPQIRSVVFQVGSYQDYPAFHQKMKAAADRLAAWAVSNVKPNPKLEIQEPRYLKLADSIRETASLYRAIFLAVDAMLLLLIGGLSWYLISRKKREIFVFYSIGMKKRQIAGHYCGYYVLLVLPAAILGTMLGYFLNLLLSIKIARDTVALQEELLRFSNNGQAVARSIDAAIRAYDVGPAAILGGGAVTVAVTAAVTAGIVLLALAFLLRRQPRDFVRGEGL